MICLPFIMLKLPDIFQFIHMVFKEPHMIILNTAYNDETIVYHIMKDELCILLRFHYITIQAPHII